MPQNSPATRGKSSKTSRATPASAGPARSPEKATKTPATPARAPAFDLESDGGDRLKLRDFAGKWTILYFYPKDNTPGCTREAQDFTRAVPRLKKLGAEVVGVSKDSVKSHCGFKEKIGIGFTLLSDPDLNAHKAYGAWGTKTMYGKKVEGVIRSTFLVSPEGKIVRSWSGVKVDGHADKVLAALEEAKGAS